MYFTFFKFDTELVDIMNSLVGLCLGSFKCFKDLLALGYSECFSGLQALLGGFVGEFRLFDY
jgi:hypothetical protein